MNKPKVRVENRNGVRCEVVYGEPDYPRGRIQIAECDCFGSTMRVHSNQACPVLKAQVAAALEAAPTATPTNTPDLP